jgi:catechol 2,3-dioxygenase-like lactoylglutathione lyase family enzyme
LDIDFPAPTKPMIKAFNHVGMSVASLERAMDFYGKALGMTALSAPRTFGPGYAQGNYETILRLPGATGRVCTLASACGFRIELFEFSHPTPQQADANRPVCDHGITHFCVEVDDIEAEYQRILGAGGIFHAPPLQFFGRIKAAYARDPDGNVFELIEAIQPSHNLRPAATI